MHAGMTGVLLIGSMLATAGADDWVLPDSRLGVRTAPILLLSRPDVQADLGFTPEQADATQRAIADLYQRAASLRGKPDAEALAGRRAIDEAQVRWLDSNLDDAQRARLSQLELQWEGPAALASRPWLADRLGLSPEQRREVADLLTRQAQVAGPSRPASLEVLNHLGPEQEARWRELLGRPLAFRLAAQPAPAARR